MLLMKTVRLTRPKMLLTGVILVLLILMTFKIISSLSLETHSVPAVPGKTVIIDAGHGGVDGGAVASSGILEKDLNLQIALYLKHRLEEQDVTVIMVRENDLSLHDPSADSIRNKKRSDLKHRLELMNAHPDALVVSIHQNTFTESQYRGAQMFYGVHHPQSPIVAQYIQDAIVAELQPDNQRKIKKAPSSVFLLQHATPAMVLIECGFLSNPEELALLSSDSYQQQMAAAICGGILNYYHDASLSAQEPSTDEEALSSRAARKPATETP